MSRISDRYLNSVVYLYGSSSSAQQGKWEGGTGFLFGTPVPGSETQYTVYVITCRHVLRDQENCIRINTEGKSHKIITTKREDWLEHPTEDVAAYGLSPDPQFQAGFIRANGDVVNQDLLQRFDIGPGDDAFVIGRFISHAGVEQNTPTVRFGNIAMMPLEPIYNTGINCSNLSYLVDMRIKAGFSGSPVFVQYRNRFERGEGPSSGPWDAELLLGIAWGEYTASEQIEISPLHTQLPLQVPIP